MEATQRSRVPFPVATLRNVLRACALLGLCIGLLGMHFIAATGQVNPAPSAAPHSAVLHADAKHPSSGHTAQCQTDCALEHSLGAACAAAFPLLVLALRRPKTYSRLEAPVALLLKPSSRIVAGFSSTPSLVELSISRT